MIEHEKTRSDIYHLFQILRRRKWLILSCFLGVITPIVYFNQTSLPVYEASTTIVYEEVEGAISTLNPMQSSFGRSFIVNQIEEIKSRSLSEDVAKALPSDIVNTFRFPEPLPPDFDKEKYISSIIHGNISADPVANSDVIKIKARANTPRAAMVIANTVAQVLKERNLKVRREETSNVRRLIEDQLRKFKKQLEDAEEALRRYKEKNKITSLDQEASQIFERITEAEVLYNQAKTNREAAEKRLSYIQQKLSEQRNQLIPSITETASPWIQKLKERLIDLEVQYTTLKVQDYPESHPKMRKLKDQIEQTKQNLKEEALRIAQGENVIDPLSQIQKFLEESVVLEIEIKTYQAQEDALRKIIDNYNMNLKSVPQKELELARLIRDREVNDKIYTMLLEKREEAKIAEAEKTGNIRIIDPANMPKRPIRPRKLLNIIIGLIVGCTLGGGLVFFLESLDTSIKTIEEIEKYADLPVLGSIPKIKSVGNITKNGRRKDSKKNLKLVSKLIAGREPNSPAAEAFRALRTSIKFARFGSPVKTILITSANPEEGKSLVAANLAIATAQMDLKTLLIDADLRKPVLHTLFETEMRPGLVDMLFSISGNFETKQILTQEDYFPTHSNSEEIPLKQYEASNTNTSVSSIKTLIKETIHSTTISHLYLITCGAIPPNPSEVLASKAMRDLIAIFRNKFDVVILDLPPVLAVTDATVLAPVVDGVILVIRSGKSKQGEILRVKSLLERVKSNVLGAVLNNVDTQRGYYPSYYYYYSKK